jgi:membrane-bound ClpP family serine protease
MIVYALGFASLLLGLLSITILGKISAFGVICVLGIAAVVLSTIIVAVKVDTTMQMLFLCFFLSFVFLAVSVSFSLSEIDPKSDKASKREPGNRRFTYRS